MLSCAKCGSSSENNIGLTIKAVSFDKRGQCCICATTLHVPRAHHLTFMNILFPSNSNSGNNGNLGNRWAQIYKNNQLMWSSNCKEWNSMYFLGFLRNKENFVLTRTLQRSFSFWRNNSKRKLMADCPQTVIILKHSKGKHHTQP